MTSRRRAGRKWPWAAGILLLVLITGYYFIWPASSSQSQPTQHTDDVLAQLQQAEAKRASDAPVPVAPPAPRTVPPPARSLDTAPPPVSIPAKQLKPKAIEKVEPVVAQRKPAPKPKPSRQTEPSPVHSSALGDAISRGLRLYAEGNLVEARRQFNDVLLGRRGRLSRAQTQAIRNQIMHINDKLIFSKQVAPADPLVELYTIKKGDVLSKIALSYRIPHQFIEQINQVRPKRIRPGQRIKVVKGPFHAVVTKSTYRMDMYLKDAQSRSVYICSFDVGLGADDSTPIGRFIIRRGYKQQNPSWNNPRTGKRFERDDPNNPIGEYWIGLEGTDKATHDLQGYGIHGTIEPDSIGRQASMGCMRLAPDDIALVYAMLSEGHSTVLIRR